MHSVVEGLLVGHGTQKRYRLSDQNTFVPNSVHIGLGAIATSAPMSSMGVQGTESEWVGLVSSVYGEEYFIASLADTGI